METPDILNSKIKKIRIELPNYSFSHSSSGDSPHPFIGRKLSLEKLKGLVEDDSDKTGVYLVAGNRGVGKTSLVSEVIKQTSFVPESNFVKNLKYLLILFFAVIGTQFCMQVFPQIAQIFGIIMFIFTPFVIFFFLQWCFCDFGRKTRKQNTILKKMGSLYTAVNDLGYLINPRRRYGRTHYILKVVVVVCFTQVINIISWNGISPTMAFMGYLPILFILMAYRFEKETSQKKPRSKAIFNFCFWYDEICKAIDKYVKKHDRLYLRINFGHKLKDEKDILRLIARTISTEYNKYHRSFRRMLPRRVFEFVILFAAASLFSGVVKEQKFYKPIKESALYQNSSQILLDIRDSVYSKVNCPMCSKKAVKLSMFLEKDSMRLEGTFSKVGTNIKTKIETKVEAKIDTVEKKLSEHTTVETKVGAMTNIKPSDFWLVPDQIIFEITKGVKKSRQFFLCKYNKTEYKNSFVFPIDYLFWLIFFLMYLFSVLLFRSTWITHFFVTHQVIKRRLKRLNSDITHSTERENSITVSSGNVGSVLGTRTKRSRDVADAREIEKELQDVLNDMQRIPIVMCRPRVVIVFDELDKVEPGDATLEKETPQTKASMFSINATRERQTEILRILSNMKYFLSTASAKFIFIAGREMFDIHLADVSERNNYIGSIFNAVIHIPSLLTDHPPTNKDSTREESSIASLPEKFVCGNLFPCDYKVKSYTLKNYRVYLEEKIFREDRQNTKQEEDTRQEKIEKIIAVLQQLIIYLAHVSKGAPKKMIQLFESFIEVGDDKNKEKDCLLVQHCHYSQHFLVFNYYKQYTIGIIAYLITPIFYRLAESNIKAHSDKLLVSSLRFVDFLFKFHKHSFSWWHLDISPELLEANRAPELKSVTEDLLKYLTQVHIDELSFCFSNYKFNSIIANEIFAMTKTDEVFSALFSFSLDETLSLKKHYIDLLEKTEKGYRKQKKSSSYIDVVSSLQAVLGDLYYYDDELEEAELYYNKAIQAFREWESENSDNKKNLATRMIHDRFYLYIRNMLRLGMIYERRKLYESAYMVYGESCRRIIRERNMEFQKLGVDIRRSSLDGKNVFVKASQVKTKEKNGKNNYDNIEAPLVRYGEEIEASIASLQPLKFRSFLPETYDLMFKRMTYEGLKTYYVPFVAKLQILEKSHAGGITSCHLELLDKELKYLTFIVDHNEAKILEAEIYTRVADILYYKNSDLKNKKGKNRKTDNDKDGSEVNNSTNVLSENSSCTACYYYHKALSILLGKLGKLDKEENTVMKLLSASLERLKSNDNKNYNMKHCTILARILSDWGNVFFSCDSEDKKDDCMCYIYDGVDCNTRKHRFFYNHYVCDITDYERNNLGIILEKYIDSYDFTKMDIAFAMYSISSEAYRNANQYKLSAYQIYKMLRLFKCYKIYSIFHINKLSKKAINYLWRANDDLNMPELNKRKKDFDRVKFNEKITLQHLLVDTEITRIRVLVNELKLEKLTSDPNIKPEYLKQFYDIRITSPYKINYSIVGRIYQLRLKSKVNYNTYLLLLVRVGALKSMHENTSEEKLEKKKFTLEQEYYDLLVNNVDENIIKEIFEEKLTIVEAVENIIAETIYCLVDIIQLTKTLGESYLFSHSLFGSVHESLSFWIRQYEAYETYKDDSSKIDDYLKKYLDEEWRELLSGYRENQQALSHYYKCLEMHSEGRMYHNKIDLLCYVSDDYNDRSDHCNIAEDRHLFMNGEIEKRINAIKDIYKDSKLYNVDNYFYRDYIDPQI